LEDAWLEAPALRFLSQLVFIKARAQKIQEMEKQYKNKQVM